MTSTSISPNWHAIQRPTASCWIRRTGICAGSSADWASRLICCVTGRRTNGSARSWPSGSPSVASTARSCWPWTASTTWKDVLTHRIPAGLPTTTLSPIWPRRCPSILFGASVHPYRADALEELHRLIMRGACLVKWIPSAQRIRPDCHRCIPFYDLLAEKRVPLLVHTGNEHASSRSLNQWNDPALLQLALKRGVTVIAAHCGARVFLHERCYFSTFHRMALEHQNLYGDLGAFGIPTRIRILRAMQRCDRLLSKIVYASDFPAWVMPRWFIFSIGRQAVREIVQEKNPLQKPYLLMQKMGMPEEIFSRAGELLRIDRTHRRDT